MPTPPKVAVASTVGAGDSLLAGMLHGLLSGEAPEHTLRRATAIAAMAVTQIGFGISDDAQLAHLESGVARTPADRTIRGFVMKLAIVTACPNGMVTSVLCARLLDAAAQRQGWSTSVEVVDVQHPERAAVPGDH